MTANSTASGEMVWDLPPLILHPFNERVSPADLLENSKAALMLSGLIPGDGSDEEGLRHRLLAGRYSEVRMLFFLGKDIFRWIDQCVECTARVAELEASGLQAQSFAALVAGDPPLAVREKLVRWGVADYTSVFSRAIGLHVLFAEPPEFSALSPEFLGHYHRYADALYLCFLQAQPYRPAPSRSFRFDLYASGEYSRLLETEWEGQ